MSNLKRFFAITMIVCALSVSALADDGQSPVGDYAGQSPIGDRMSQEQIPTGNYALSAIATVVANIVGLI